MEHVRTFPSVCPRSPARPLSVCALLLLLHLAPLRVLHPVSSSLPLFASLPERGWESVCPQVGGHAAAKGRKRGSGSSHTAARSRRWTRSPSPPPPPLNLLSRVSHARDIGNIGLELLIANAAHVNLLTVQYVWIRMRITLRVS